PYMLSTIMDLGADSSRQMTVVYTTGPDDVLPPLTTATKMITTAEPAVASADGRRDCATTMGESGVANTYGTQSTTDQCNSSIQVTLSGMAGGEVLISTAASFTEDVATLEHTSSRSASAAVTITKVELAEGSTLESPSSKISLRPNGESAETDETSQTEMKTAGESDRPTITELTKSFNQSNTSEKKISTPNENHFSNWAQGEQNTMGKPVVSSTAFTSVTRKSQTANKTTVDFGEQPKKTSAAAVTETYHGPIILSETAVPAYTQPLDENPETKDPLATEFPPLMSTTLVYLISPDSALRSVTSLSTKSAYSQSWLHPSHEDHRPSLMTSMPTSTSFEDLTASFTSGALLTSSEDTLKSSGTPPYVTNPDEMLISGPSTQTSVAGSQRPFDSTHDITLSTFERSTTSSSLTDFALSSTTQQTMFLQSTSKTGPVLESNSRYVEDKDHIVTPPSEGISKLPTSTEETPARPEAILSTSTMSATGLSTYQNDITTTISSVAFADRITTATVLPYRSSTLNTGKEERRNEIENERALAEMACSLRGTKPIWGIICDLSKTAEFDESVH
uniref:Uncharacterized protein n=1 Tax=Parascaris univalens TaxID=6257 RepID=A0A914ZX33_PARUN